jgi:hypothetical protein
MGPLLTLKRFSRALIVYTFYYPLFYSLLVLQRPGLRLRVTAPFDYTLSKLILLLPNIVPNFERALCTLLTYSPHTEVVNDSNIRDSSFKLDIYR